METIILKGEKIKIRELSNKDLKNILDFLNYINSLVKEGAKISLKKEKSLKEGKDFLKKSLKEIKNKEKFSLLAEVNDKIIAMASLDLYEEIRDHIAEFSIGILKSHRGIGLGKYLMKEVIDRGIKKLKTKIKIIRLNLYSNNKIALSLYKKMGFKVVAKIPKDIQYKGKLIDSIVMIKFLKNEK